MGGPAIGSSTSSDEREWGVEDFWGDDCLMLALVGRSVRPDETEEEEVLWAGGSLWRGCVVLARDERRGDIAKAGAQYSDVSTGLSVAATASRCGLERMDVGLTSTERAGQKLRQASKGEDCTGWATDECEVRD